MKMLRSVAATAALCLLATAHTSLACDVAECLSTATRGMNGAVDDLKAKLVKVPAGKASTALLETVAVAAYGDTQPMIQLATIKVADASTLTVQPFDPSTTPEIAKAIQKTGLTPTPEGKLLRVAVPPLTAERRASAVKDVMNLSLTARTVVQRVASETRSELKASESSKDLTADQLADGLKRVDTLTSEKTALIDGMKAAKLKELGP